ncbi:unnamed protein product, partial [Thelazia callipaeda]|uniref:G_PROTEIN_RECEP_F1_2 domain-containing protein n=1 Tax=Thelazia callipaeda TaxID=103827 RepID=A0A0N5D0C6_THECL
VFSDYKYSEDSNDNLSYINCRLVVPSVIFAIISIMAISLGITLGHFYDLKRKEEGNIPTWLNASGWYSNHCQNSTSVTVPEKYLPSILRILELTVQANVLFRVATCIPNSLRIFQSYLNSVMNSYFCPDIKEWRWYRICNTITPILLLFEVSACTVFSINTIRQDYQIYKIAFHCFLMSALMHMVTSTAAAIYRTNKKFEIIDRISVMIKLISFITFGTTAPKVAVTHNSFINLPGCHYYVPAYQALFEYALIVSNAAFHLTAIIDTRNLRFLLYPRTCSGECEPLSPRNFQKGGKFEHCRSEHHLDKKRLKNSLKMRQTRS